MPAKTSLQLGPTLRRFFAPSFPCPKESIEHGTKVDLDHIEFLGADRHHIRQVIDACGTRGGLFLICFLPTVAYRPRGLFGDAARVKALAEIGVSPYRVGRTARGPHGDISQPQAENTSQTQLNAADAKRIWRGMVEIGSEKTEKDQALMQASRPRWGLPKVGDSEVLR